MKKLLTIAMLLCLWGQVDSAAAVSYGDLYEMEWCPCNPDDKFDAKGSVVLGRTIMCPCDSMYEGYHSSLEKDVRKVKAKAEQTIEKAKNFKYYVGFDYNKWQITDADDTLNFDSGKSVPAGMVADHQDNIGVVLGMRPTPNLGVEAFYNRTYNKNKITQITTAPLPGTHQVDTFMTKYQGFGVDLLGYMPVTDYFDFIAFVGIGRYKFDTQADFEVRNTLGVTSRIEDDLSDTTLAYRLGGGFQFNIARGLVLRTMYRYIKLNNDLFKFTQEFSFGIRFLF